VAGDGADAVHKVTAANARVLRQSTFWCMERRICPLFWCMERRIYSRFCAWSAVFDTCCARRCCSGFWRCRRRLHELLHSLKISRLVVLSVCVCVCVFVVAWFFCLKGAAAAAVTGGADDDRDEAHAVQR
jgi:hypothetical protein